MSFEDLPIHDASLLKIRIDWTIRQCEFLISPQSQIPHSLIFDDFRHIELPRNESWGRSISILETRVAAPEVFEILLQSGDVLRVEAREWTFFETPSQ